MLPFTSRGSGLSRLAATAAPTTTKEVNMKLMVSAKPFTAELKSVLPAVANRPGLPLLLGVRLEVLEGEVAIEATDLELTARRVVRREVTVDGAGSVVVPAKALV